MTSRLPSIAVLIALLLPAAAQAEELYACGSGQVRRYSEQEDGSWRETWRWTARDARADLLDSFRRALENTDECKPVSRGRSIIITASTGGVMLLNAQDSTVRFAAVEPNAHSAEVLPGLRLVVAVSTGRKGNLFRVYDMKSGRPLFSVPADSAHGVVWDEKRGRLFGLSYEVLQAFELVDWGSDRPSLRETGRWQLPGRQNGHNLAADADRSRYLVTTEDGTWRFDPDTGAFSPLVPLNRAGDVKAISASSTGRLAWVQQEVSWWARGFHVQDRNGSEQRVETPDMHLYKVRWIE